MAIWRLQVKFTGGEISLDYDNLMEANKRADKIRTDGFNFEPEDESKRSGGFGLKTEVEGLRSTRNELIKELYYPRETLLMIRMTEIKTGK